MCKVNKYLDIKNYFWEKRLVRKLVLECEDEILNTAKTLTIKKVSCGKSKCLIHTVSLIIINLLLLIVICVSCCFYCKNIDENIYYCFMTPRLNLKKLVLKTYKNRKQ